MSSLPPGRYQLSAKAYDQADNVISEASEKFALISDPGPDGLSDEVRLAIVRAANLDSYPPEALAETTEWVVWVTPGESSPELAASIGAIDQGGTGHIPNTFIWKFPEGSAPENVAAELRALPGVEYAYPQVPVQLHLLYAPKDTLYKKQWNLANANVPAAWDVIINPATSQTARGRNVTIAIVDDGLEHKHPDLKSRYNSSLSWDFTDQDSDPSPSSSTRSVDALLSPQGNGGNSFNFYFPVNLTGMVKDVQLNFNFPQSLPPNLPQPEELQVSLSSPNKPAFNPFYRVPSFGARRWWPGRNDLKFTPNVSRVRLTKNTSQSFTPNQSTFYPNPGTFYRNSAVGNWELEIKIPNLDSNNYDEDKMQQLRQ